METPPAIEPAELPESKYLRAGNKNFYFDVGSNNRGVFLRISEVKPGFRTAVTIPEKAWGRFRDNISDFISSMESERSTLGGPIASSAADNNDQQQKSTQEAQSLRQQNRTAFFPADSSSTGISPPSVEKTSVQTPPTTPDKFYEKLKTVYELPRWTCECTWRPCLTHEEACESENDVRKSLPTLVPSYYNKIILDIVHHNVKPLEKLAEEVSLSIGSGYVVGETVQFRKKKDSQTVKGIVEKIQELSETNGSTTDEHLKRSSERKSTPTQPKSTPEKIVKNFKYSIRLLNDDKIITNVIPTDLQRPTPIPNREKLKTFIRSYAIRLGNRIDSPWILFDNNIKQKYQVKDRISDNVIQKFKKELSITLEEILREQERIRRKQTEEADNEGASATTTTTANSKATPSRNGWSYDENNHIVLHESDDDEDESVPLSKLVAQMTSPTKQPHPNQYSSKSRSPSLKKKSSTSTNKVQPSSSSSKHSKKDQRSSSTSKNKKLSSNAKQLTLTDMKFTKNSSTSPSSSQKLLKSIPTPHAHQVIVPLAILQRLDRTKKEKGLQSKLFQRLTLHCARTLTDKQRQRLPDEYRLLIQAKYEYLEEKKQLSQMNEHDRRLYLQEKQKQRIKEQQPCEDLDLLPIMKALPPPILLDIDNSNYVGHLLMICTFFTSCHGLFISTLTTNQTTKHDLSKSTQIFLKTFKHDYLLNAYKTNTTGIFFNYFNELCLILMKLLFKEDEKKSYSDENDNDTEELQIEHNGSEKNDDSNEAITSNTVLTNDELQHNYSISITDITLNLFTCQELTRLYLLKEKNHQHRIIIDKLTSDEYNQFSINEQIDLLLLLINIIINDNDLMNDYFDYLHRQMTETLKERTKLVGEKRKQIEEENKLKKLQLQNGEHKTSSKSKKFKSLPVKTSQNNDENQQNGIITPITSTTAIDEMTGIEDDDDLKSISQRRRQKVQESKELKEKKEIEAQKLYNDQKRDANIQRADLAYQEALKNVHLGLRIKPLGYDRNCNRYWYFKGYAGIFVESGWISSNIDYNVQHHQPISNSQTSSSSYTADNDDCIKNQSNEKCIPKFDQNRWYTYNDEKTIEQLIQSLHDRGIREQELLINLKKCLPFIKSEFEQLGKKQQKSIDETLSGQPQPSTSTETIAGDTESTSSQITEKDFSTEQFDIINGFKSDLEEIENRLRLGSLGGFIVTDNYDEWHEKLLNTTNRQELGDLLIQLQQTVVEKYATGIFGNREKRRQQQIHSGKNKKKSKLNYVQSSAHALQTWINDVKTCKTYSRLHVLMTIFETAIAWEKSTIGVKCKVCRKKNKDDNILLCDQCCHGYHIECLRDFSIDSKFSSSSADLWYCPACRPQPTSKRRTRPQRGGNKKIHYYNGDIYNDDVVDVDNEEDDVLSNNNQDVAYDNMSVGEENGNEFNDDDSEMDIDENDACCRVCGYEADEDNELVQCSQCKSRYHCQCHEPALRHPPRSSNWVCNTCRTGSGGVSDDRRSIRLRNRRQSKKIDKRKLQRGRKRANNTDDDDDGDDDDDDDDVSYTGRSTRSRRKKREISDEEEEDEEEEEAAADEQTIEEDEGVQRRSSKRLRKSDAKPFVYKPRRVRIEKSTSSSEQANDDEIASEESGKENDVYHSSDTTSEDENDAEIKNVSEKSPTQNENENLSS
ncbi:unnamed protein product [Didymodactylos carnosus]|uniref:Uncharacterized protein n=1 Tax=Didymodactylos carnosus TaxID=1234261 RepID=A0A813TTN5_9BILA|nr:unnamed protein product [Didymodactylos carnosus]CAF0819169.1 unnamed protein product [Didymodactylos carnosus]CAF3558780.1 unnamed protein product [Didymodactylos carnosus]CAF3605493.1 unnamed protein product [Didymodactylos carnosus]